MFDHYLKLINNHLKYFQIHDKCCPHHDSASCKRRIMNVVYELVLEGSK